MIPPQEIKYFFSNDFGKAFVNNDQPMIETKLNFSEYYQA